MSARKRNPAAGNGGASKKSTRRQRDRVQYNAPDRAHDDAAREAFTDLAGRPLLLCVACEVCGRPLWGEASRESGVGPVCGRGDAR